MTRLEDYEHPWLEKQVHRFLFENVMCLIVIQICFWDKNSLSFFGYFSGKLNCGHVFFDTL